MEYVYGIRAATMNKHARIPYNIHTMQFFYDHVGTFLKFLVANQTKIGIDRKKRKQLFAR